MASLVTRNGIDVSALDERTYKSITLSNSLQVLVISDPKAEKSAAAMDVHVGHQSDPDEVPGLAHFLEHMLFLGTAKYPDEKSYKQFLSSHSGRSNASTSPMHTNFYFDVLSDHLYAALDRFAQFFIAPLFTPEAAQREMNAVNSENAKNLQNDHRRLYQLQKALSNPAHPYHKFGTGNLETLGTRPLENGVDVRAALLDFYATYYSASIMKLVICGKETVATLERWAQELFAGIKNTGRSFPTFGDAVPFDEARLAQVVHVTPVKDLHVINLAWPLPSLYYDYLTKPTQMLSHLMGHEGPGSILSYLKAQKWANGLSAGLFSDNEDWALFAVKVDVTDAGIEHVDHVVEAVFQYIALLRRETALAPWLFQETQDLALQRFCFKSKETPIHYTSQLASGMHRYPPKYLLSGDYLLYEYDEKKVQTVLHRLTPYRLLLTVVSKTFAGKTHSVEQWYQTPYSAAPLALELLQRWTAPPAHPAFKLPHPNAFLCTDFSIVTPPRPSHKSDRASITSPMLLQQEEYCRLWYQPDVAFRQPKMLLHFRIYAPSVSTTLFQSVLTTLFVRYLKDTLTEVAYDAELAGMEYDLGVTARAVELHVGGYSHKVPTLLSTVLHQLMAMTAEAYVYDPAVFARVKDRTARLYENFFQEEPYQHAVYVGSQLLELSRWSVDDKLRALQHIGLPAFTAHSQRLFPQVFIEAFMYGNLRECTARALMEQVCHAFGFDNKAPGRCPLFASQRTKPRMVQLSDACEYRHYRRNWHAANLNSALCTLYQIYHETDRATCLALCARLELFAHLLKAPCFHQLRTQEQLGYLVFSGLVRTHGVHYLRILVQSDVASPLLLDQRIESFVDHFRAHLTAMPLATWQQHVHAVVQALKEQPKHEMEDASRVWREIADETYVFDRRQRVASLVSTLRPRDLVAFYDEFLAVDATRRRKLCIGLYGAKHFLSEWKRDPRTDAATPLATGLTAAMLLQQQVAPAKTRRVDGIDNVTAFKQQMPLFPECPRACL